MQGIQFVTHYTRHAPETDNTREHVARERFNDSHIAELQRMGAHVYALPLTRAWALELVNKWNRNAESFRYWIE